MKIAHHFNGGHWGMVNNVSPLGTAEMIDTTRITYMFSRPYGTHCWSFSYPALKHWAITKCPHGAKTLP